MKASNLSAWFRHLSSARGPYASIVQMRRMYQYHRIPFDTILGNIFGVLERYDARFTFTIVASIATEELLQMLRERGHEIASHSLYHVKHSGLPFETQLGYIKRSLELLEAQGSPVRGFRAPYNSYDINTFRCLDRLGLAYDSGVRRGERFHELTKPFHLVIDGVSSKFLSFPVCHLSDEALDQSSKTTVLKLFFNYIDTIPDNGMGVLQLHPVRIGQPRYLEFLERLIGYLASRGYLMPTLIEVAEGKAETPAVCLSGDIDCLSFFDYLRRI